MASISIFPGKCSCSYGTNYCINNECHHLYHGEKVAFGTLTQLVLENAPYDEIKEVIHFCKKVGVPTTLEQLGIKEIKKEDIIKVAEASCDPNETIHAMPFKVTPYDVYAAILTADKLGSDS